MSVEKFFVSRDRYIDFRRFKTKHATWSNASFGLFRRYEGLYMASRT